MIPSFNTSSALFFLCLVFFLSLCNTKVRSLTTYYCPNTTTYTPSSTYQSNLNYLFSVLSSNSTNINGFYHFTAGLSPPDIAYGLFLCRGDISTDSCQDCVAGATKEIIQLCPNQKSAMIWHGNCFLRFSNQSMFSIADQSISLILYNMQNVTEPNRFEEVLGVVMNDVVSRASNSWSGKKFATKEANFTSNQTLYGLAQCTPDVSGSDCNTCLRNALSNLPNCCGGKQGARVLLPSCSIRYEVYPFNNPNNNAVYAIYNATAPPPSPVVRPPPTGPTSSPGSKVKKMTITISISSLIVVALLGSCIYYHKRKIIEKGERFGDDYNCENFQREKHTKSQDFPSIQLDLIRVATNYFSKENKLGEGGFGPVYKGTLLDGKEIAVKRLSRTSDQGLQELKNEVTLIAKLQHRNLVKLLGCCLEGNESLLIYEYMPNKSLDVFLFDSTKGGQLDWKRRFLIINGVAKGLLYLHEDSRLRIIHRDLKTSNVLLDHEMNPKISDFGMARIFCGNQIEANTNRIVGTYGYMAPEYAMEGLFSIKSDVFSFGVLLLEMISGKRNSGFYLSDHGHSLLTFAWKLWSEGQGLELMDPLLVRSCVVVEVSKCIQIGLLCVQEDAADRPTMSSVVVMLRSDTATLPRPTQPAFSVGRLVMKSTQASPNVKLLSVNEITLSDVSPR